MRFAEGFAIRGIAGKEGSDDRCGAHKRAQVIEAGCGSGGGRGRRNRFRGDLLHRLRGRGCGFRYLGLAGDVFSRRRLQSFRFGLLTKEGRDHGIGAYERRQVFKGNRGLGDWLCRMVFRDRRQCEVGDDQGCGWIEGQFIAALDRLLVDGVQRKFEAEIGCGAQFENVVVEAGFQRGNVRNIDDLGRRRVGFAGDR